MARLPQWLARLAGPWKARWGSSSRSSHANGEACLTDFLAHTTGIVSFYDHDLRLSRYATIFKSIYGEAAVTGAPVWDIYLDLRQPGLRDGLDRVRASGEPMRFELLRGANEPAGSAFIFRASDGIAIIESRDNGQRSAHEIEHAMLLHQATHDVLTGLQNRRRFSERLEDALSDVEGSKAKVALLQIDLDGFKAVNDTLGHGTGDSLLQLAAGRIQDALEGDESAYRYAGDEFAVIQVGKEQPAEAQRLAGALVDSLKSPFVINGMPLFVGASVGIAFAPEDGTEGEQLMKAADIALYAAKRDGRGCARVFNRSMLLLLEQRESLRRSLRTALHRGELFLEYQPLVRPPSTVVGFEALLRWRHPEIGVIPPSVFIPIAEADGLMEEIGRWVLEEACQQATTWPSSMTISVNLSPAQFLSGRLTDTVAQVIDAVGIRADRLELEITESVLLEKTIDNLDTLNTLNILGIGIALDDFGTYYSSLSYLKNFPFDTLKIDKYFINDIEIDPKGQTIVRSIMAMAHGLGTRVIAEGVETEAQARWLMDRGCDCLQGIYLSGPLSAEGARRFLHGRSPMFARAREEPEHRSF